MHKNEISFVSVRGRGINADLKLVKDYLAAHLPDTAYSYYMNKNTYKVPVINQKMREGLQDFCEGTRDLICMDMSLPSKIYKNIPDKKWMFLASLYAYLFNDMMRYNKTEKFKKKNTFRNCNYVMPGSPFASKVLKSCYNWEEDTVFLDGICLPSAWDVMQPVQQIAKREKLEFYCPASREKKIVSIILEGKKKEEDLERNFFEGFDLKKFLDTLGEEWLLITNNPDLVELSSQLSFRYADRFCYTKNRLLLHDLLYISDSIVTNASKIATTFAVTKKPLYYLEYTAKPWSNYLKERYPSLCLSEISELYAIDFNALHLSEEQQKFCQEFSYGTEINPFVEISNIFNAK